MEIVEQIQPDIFAKLQAEPYFATISIFAIREGRVQTSIDQALSGAGLDPNQAGKLAGATIEILMPMFVDAAPDAPGPEATVQQRFIVKENPTINLADGGTGLTAESIAERIIRTLHKFAMAYGLGWSGLTFYPASNCITPNRDFLADGIIAYDVLMLARHNCQPLPPTPNPILHCPALTVTLTMPPGPQGNPNKWVGVPIYYTTDGSFPGPGPTCIRNADQTLAPSTAQIYTGPFNVAPGTELRTAAWAPGFTSSNVSYHVIT